jgi:hypothetical protein
MRHFVFREKIVQRRLSFVHSGPFYLAHPENGGYVLDSVRGGWSLHLLRLKKASVLRAPGRFVYRTPKHNNDQMFCSSRVN